MDTGWKVVIPARGGNFGISQGGNMLRAVSPCCQEWMHDGNCLSCRLNYTGHPNVKFWMINEHITVWGDHTQPEKWISGLTGIPEAHIRVKVDA